MEVKRHYPDLLLIPKEEPEKYFSVMIEFKYLKKGDVGGDALIDPDAPIDPKITEKQQEAKAQIQEYANFEEIKNIPNLRKYTVVAVVDKIFIEEID